ncbi:MAG: TIGR01458 family HAD-type hydrolase [Gemmatimonadetes bacterium]|uniref:Haloacid dehalogenase-like hydrolase domain-containing protein 2 n=1 Tax=Candidatus Kutchimonas denitrificans TaxID=3056748 RepID=A0AAE4Z6D0_9BACT|nr:TIGR01458 family HAD-type hydrolase [Gemmatimonadota bacterium]NIR73843.1 TIGR01458 family HAD-type hydrolase [Candidatus Kutchimonas denitrificans]NIS02488.1 TIGR01458 family HAD-type hydrolase [Gemmatimonadota bacterium]NIT68356.1 TIGR01458 family HAD-type hydrolase [Gemmatimonadota bacterium]NIU51623.1 TIGR01458 family HAD-type hydrolase [Gemmatimonadota bacterium]
MGSDKRRVKGALLDLDGTVWDDEIAPYDGAAETVARLREAGLPVRFVTNTTRLSRKALAEMLSERGLAAEADDVFTATLAGVIRLREWGVTRIAVLLPDAALSEFADFDVVEDDPEALIVGDLGAGWTFEVLNRAFRWLRAGAEFLALHRNPYWKTEGELVLDAGAFVAALEYATDSEATLVGKPSPVLFQAAARSLELEPGDLAMVGDSLRTDIPGAQAAGCLGVLVRTGKFDEVELANSDVEPDTVIDSIAKLPQALDL